MKLDIKGGDKLTLTLVAENKDDNDLILNLARQVNNGGKPQPRIVTEERLQEIVTQRKKYKRQMTKECIACGKKVKGNLGLGVHLASHPSCKSFIEEERRKEVAKYPYHCSKCGKGFTKEKSMNIHYGHSHLKGGSVKHKTTNFLGDVNSLGQHSKSSIEVIV